MSLCCQDFSQSSKWGAWAAIALLPDRPGCMPFAHARAWGDWVHSCRELAAAEVAAARQSRDVELAKGEVRLQPFTSLLHINSFI